MKYILKFYVFIFPFKIILTVEKYKYSRQCIFLRLHIMYGKIKYIFKNPELKGKKGRTTHLLSYNSANVSTFSKKYLRDYKVLPNQYNKTGN